MTRELTRRMARMAVIIGLGAGVAGCGAVGTMFPEFEMRPAGNDGPMAGGSAMGAGAAMDPNAPAMPRRTIMPETLVGCRGHVVVPALGMTLVPTGGPPPVSGQYLREERLTAPYRVIRPGDRITTDRNPSRLNVELDRMGRIIDLGCG